MWWIFSLLRLGWWVINCPAWCWPFGLERCSTSTTSWFNMQERYIILGNLLVTMIKLIIPNPRLACSSATTELAHLCPWSQRVNAWCLFSPQPSRNATRMLWECGVVSRWNWTVEIQTWTNVPQHLSRSVVLSLIIDVVYSCTCRYQSKIVQSIQMCKIVQSIQMCKIVQSIQMCKIVQSIQMCNS